MKRRFHGRGFVTGGVASCLAALLIAFGDAAHADDRVENADEAVAVDLAAVELPPAESSRADADALSKTLASPRVEKELRALRRHAGWGWSDLEAATWLIEDGTGKESLRFVAWPFSGDYQRARWAGPLPAGAIAIVHTHRNDRPRPSENDIRVAAAMGIPVVVTTVHALWYVSPSGRLRHVDAGPTNVARAVANVDAR